MKFFARLIIGVFLLVANAAAGVYFFHRPLIESVSETILAGAGFERPDAHLRDVSVSRLRYGEITAADEAIRLSDVELEFDLRELVFDRRARAVKIGAGEAAATFGADKTVAVRGFTYAPSGEPGGGAPFDAVTLDAFRLRVETPKGPLTATLNGRFDLAHGGAIKAAFSADAAGFDAAFAERVTGDIGLAFNDDGSFTAAGDIVADLATPVGAVHGAAMEFDGVLRDWRAAPLSGVIDIALRSSSIDAGDEDALASGLSGLIDEDGARSLGVSGDFSVGFSQDGVDLRLDGAPVRVTGLRGGGDLLVSPRDAPFASWRDGRMSVSAQAELAGGAYRGAAVIDAASGGDGAWSYALTGHLSEPSVSGFSFGEVTAASEGEYRDGKIDGVADVSALVRKADVGRLGVNNLPVSGRVALGVDIAAREMTISAIDENCLAAPSADLSLTGQDLEARLSGASLCAADAPFAVISWSDEVVADVAGVLSAKDGRLRIGKTTMAGAPPNVRFTATHEHETHTTIITGGFDGGAILLNDALNLSRSDGAFRGGLVGEALTFDAQIERMRVAQARDVEFVAPVAVNGAARLENDVVNFDFDVKTPSGAALGHGAGAHEVRSGKGEAIFSSEDVVFARGGLQPQTLMPVLLGVIFDASGVGVGEARFSWAPGVVNSAADIEVADLSFGGPTVAVTRTEGVSGRVDFTNLSPVKTDGPQNIMIGKVDLDALKLEDGRMQFELPGDETLHVVVAEFPWFGGAIGAYDAVAPLSGGAAELKLQISDVSLDDLLSYFKIEGLSGEGRVEGLLPLSVDNGKARINEGVLSANGPGVIRYQGKMTDQAAGANQQAQLAFEVLRELRFTSLVATIDGALDGELSFKIFIEGTGNIPIVAGGKTQRIDSPVRYRISIDAPLMRLIDQAITSTNVRLQIKKAQDQAAAGRANDEAEPN
ncbi:MAG: YdbH domain-containing protein [Parvularculaceae bacterium]